MIKQNFIVLLYNKDVTCVIDTGNNEPMCQATSRITRRSGSNPLPSHDPYIPRSNAVLFNCTVECNLTASNSFTDLILPNNVLKSCFKQGSESYQCEPIRYHHLKNEDKLLFLSKTISDKSFYIVDCLIYSEGDRVCHRKDDIGDSHANLVDTGTLARPKEESVLSQDEFICEESNVKEVNCDLNPYVPFEDGLKLKDSMKFGDTVLLKTGTYVVILTRQCKGSWCGYSGKVTPTRRNSMYRPPGGSVYRCFYAKKQQVFACSVLAALDGYSAQQDPDQFHIQTDEDDERYFLYQTHNGQYRKERRLKDGSVVGATGWVGADGYLRLQEYIADNEGYRIYKSKTVYVGVDRPISESIQMAKTAPTDPGFGVTPAPARTVQRNRGPPRVSVASTTQPPPPSSTYDPTNTFPIEVSVTPPPPTYRHPTATPQVYVSPNSIDSSTKLYDFRPTVTPITASEATSTSSPYDYDSSNTNTLDDGYYTSDSKRYDVYNPNSYRHADAWLQRQQQQPQAGIRVGDGYTPQFPSYDGVSFNRNGFRYYLPKQYHEEETGSSQERTGSFGYVDPFGIRRVIYYNTAPGEGFQIRKNNRYVGHDATPYDPRPVN